MDAKTEERNADHMEIEEASGKIGLESLRKGNESNVESSDTRKGDNDHVKEGTEKVKDEKMSKEDDNSENESGEESVKSDESSFHPSDYEDDAGFDPDKDPTEIVLKATTLKEEGNKFFNIGDLVRASRSYKKGVSILKPINKENTGDGQVKTLIVTLSNNLSMVCLKQGKPKLSMDVASKAIEVDNYNMKAYYRRAMAHKKLGNFKEAKRDLKEAVKIDSTNKTVVKELHALVKYMSENAKKQKAAAEAVFSFDNKTSILYEDKLEAEKQKKEEEERKKRAKQEVLKKRKQNWEDECVKRMAAGEDAITYENWDKERKKKEKEAKKAKKEEERRTQREAQERKRAAREAARKNVETDSNTDDELTKSELAMFRGYKKTTDGKTTSYFTREQTEHEKKLIGDITPQRLQVKTESKTEDNGDKTAQGKGKASAWNTGGVTWEEKNATSWCTAQLKHRLQKTIAMEGTLIGIITSVDDLNGEASVAVAGGRKRYIFDYHCDKVSFDIRNQEVDETVASGTFKLPDINSGNHDEVEVEITAWSEKATETSPEKIILCRNSLLSATRSSVLDFVGDFNSHY